MEFDGFRNLAPAIDGPTISLRTNPIAVMMVSGPTGAVRWFHDGRRITAVVSGLHGEIIIVGPDIHGNRIGTHRVTVEVEIDGVPYGRVVTFTVTP